MVKHLIIGGVASGMSAAARLRRLDEHAEIIVLERGGYVSYANCGLPYYIGDEISDRDELLLQTPESFKRRFNVEVRIHNEAVAIHPDTKTVTIKNVLTGAQYQETYDTLLLAPGGSPIRPTIPGCEHPAIKTLWTIPDTDEIREIVDSGTVSTALVVGGGFIGLEMAENLRFRGIRVALVEMAPQVMNVIDPEMAALVHRELRKNNIELYLNETVTGFEPLSGGGVLAQLGSGTHLEADLVLLSIGVKPNTGFLADSGIQLGARGHIIVDKHLRTNKPDIYAAGDAIEVVNPFTGKKTAIPLAGPANKQGRIAADTINGITTRCYASTMGTAIAKVFDLAVGVTGATEKFCRDEGIPYKSVITHSGHHAGYYPGAAMLSFKLLFSPETRRVLGAQVIGNQGVDKRIDVIATAIKGNMTVDDLTEIEHAYAPPYSSAKDPVNMIGFVAQNILDGLVRSITFDGVKRAVDEGAFLLDVRSPDEFMAGSIHGAVNIPIDILRHKIARLPHDKTILIFCKIGVRGYIANRILSAHGFTSCVNLSGGLDTYNAVYGL
ncbi:MAG: FAD-dependent oxidoreductase [Desulfuromonadaceae bacterium]|nr:FAD-dependent oxidoreductase [Desulfuromonadaceae bacterium]